MSGDRRQQQKEAARLRSSCRYCRRRKIKCDGESPCCACKIKSLDCVFEKQAKMGRPTQSQSPLSNGSVENRLLVDALYDIHSEMFLDHLPTSAFSVGLQSYMHEKAPYLVYGAKEMQEQKPCTPPVYDALLPVLVQDLVERCKAQYSSLGQNEWPTDDLNRPSYLAVALVRDHSSPPTLLSQPEYQDIQLDDADFSQLAQIWSTSHPLAECVLTSNAYGKDSLNKALCSFIACEAFTLVNPPQQGSEQLLEQAHRYFYERCIPRPDDPQGLLLACQISTLFSWHHIAHTTVKRGIAFLALSCQLMAQIYNDVSCKGFTLDNLKSQLSIITVWAFSQLNRTSGCLIDIGDPETSSLSHFYSLTAQMSSLLLNSHPKAYGTSLTKLQDVDFSSLCNQLRMGLRLLPLNEDSLNDGQVLIRAVRDILTVYLLFPRESHTGSTPPLQIQEILNQCSIAIPLLAKLANPTQNENHPAPLLSKVTFRRPSMGRSDVIAMKCTIASVLFITVAEALQVVFEHDKVPSSYTSAFVGVSHQLLQLHLTQVVETQQAKEVRSRLTSCLSNVDTPAAKNSNDWLENILAVPDPASSQVQQEPDAISEPDLFDTLWGQLQWDIPFDSTG